MRYCVIIILVASCICRGRIYDTYEDESEEQIVLVPPIRIHKPLDFSGLIRKNFAIELGMLAMGGNWVCSPISAVLPLAKLVIGAKMQSKTEKELLNAVGLENRNQLTHRFKQTMNELAYVKGVVVSLVARMYLSDKKTIRPSFVKRAERIFKFGIELIDTDNSVQTARSINHWVSQNTNHKIKEVVAANDISFSASLILVNAIYFLGNWKHPFHFTFKGDFHAHDRTIKVQMMRKTATFRYVDSRQLNAQIIELPYIGEDAAMIIVLPKSKNGLSILLRTLKVSTHLLTQAFNEMKSVTVEVMIPKFKIETTLDLKYYYEKMGLHHVINGDKSELRRIIKYEQVFISSAVHRAVIEVNDIGTEAAAASSVGMTPIKQILTDKKFLADHPFLFYVRAYQEQLFTGVVNKPVY